MSKHHRNIDALLDGASPTMAANIKRAMAGANQPRGEIDVTAELNKARLARETYKPAPKQKPAIRVPKARTMGKAEAEYAAILCDEFPFTFQVHRYEAITFRLNSGALYTPDLTVWKGAILILAVEVKGIVARHHSSARSILAFKTAASEWPCVAFRYAAKQKDGSFNITELNKP